MATAATHKMTFTDKAFCENCSNSSGHNECHRLNYFMEHSARQSTRRAIPSTSISIFSHSVSLFSSSVGASVVASRSCQIPTCHRKSGSVFDCSPDRHRSCEQCNREIAMCERMEYIFRRILYSATNDKLYRLQYNRNQIVFRCLACTNKPN